MKLSKLKSIALKAAFQLLMLVIIACNGSKQNRYSTYFVNSNSPIASDDGPGTKAKPWKSLIALNNHQFNPGDTIFFARSSTYTGGVIISQSGKSKLPIVMTSYGAGNSPTFSNPDITHLNGNVFQVTGRHISIDGLKFINCANSQSKEDKNILSVGAVYARNGADYLTVKNSEFFDCPIAIAINSQHCSMLNNKIHDCNRFLSEPDWGPIGILIGNGHNEIAYNTCTNYVKVGGNYGADGGFIEIDDRYFGNKVHDIKIHHNKSFDNQGFLEVEGKVTGSNIDVCYNVSNDYQQFIFYWGGDSSKVDNNTVIRTLPSNHGSVNTVFAMKNGNFKVRNNIFVVSNGIQVFVTAPYDIGNYSKVIRENNIYFCTDGSTRNPCGKNLKRNELIANPHFLNFPFDLHLQSSSPAVNNGINLNNKVDIENNPIEGLPDIGAYEYK